jgi:outer membrane protein TolC
LSAVRILIAVVAALATSLWAAPSRAQAPRLSLETAVELAVRQSLEIRAADLRVTEVSADRRTAAANLGPKLRLDSTLTLWNAPFVLDFGTGTPVVAREQFTANVLVSITQPLTGLAAQGSRYAAARSTARAVQADGAAARAEIVFRTTEAYFRLLEAASLKEIAETQIKDLAEQVRAATVLVKVGSLVPADLLRTQVAEAQARQDLLRAEAQLGTNRAQLAAILGLPVVAPIEVQPIDETNLPPLPANPQAALGDIDRLRPELAASRARVEAADSARKAAYADLLPTVNLVGAYQRTHGFGFGQPIDAGYLAGIIGWNFWEWGAQYQQARAASARKEIAATVEKQQRRDISVEVMRRYLEARASFSAIAVTRTAVVQAEEAARVMNGLYRVGSARTTDILDAQLALERARSNRARAVYDYLVAHASYQRATGQLGGLGPAPQR